VLAVDLHAGQIQGFFDIPTDNLYAAPVMAADILARNSDGNLMVVSPDVGGVVRARALAKRGSTTRRSPSSTSAATSRASPK
jgi:ribose-phosphate pyrophosphokinase